MYRMSASITLRVGFALALVVTGTYGPTPAEASGLTLEAVEQMALASDPGVEAVRANRSALDELSIAAEQLPDPMVKMGVMSLPTDTFNLGQEPMTQVQVGLVQKFPRGKSRSLRSEQIEWKSAGLSEKARDEQLQIVLAVRELFLEINKQIELARINGEAITAFNDVVDITEDYYATGRVQQSDVLQAAVELAKVEDRANRIAQDEEQARSRLAVWIGEDAYRDLDENWPRFAPPVEPDAVKHNLINHPRIQVLEKDISAADTGIELAKQRYKPEFSVDLTYGGRGGTNPDGSSRSDLLSAMVMMDLPLFHRNRQDREVAARVAESSAALYMRNDLLRRMQREADYQFATLAKQKERVTLFETVLLPEASQSAEASFGAYQSGLEDLTTLLRARITEFDLQLEYARLEAEVLKTEARLMYLEGEPK